MGNLFGSTKTYQLEIEDKTSEKYTDKRKIYFEGMESGGKWWDIFFCGIFRSVYEQGPTLKKNVKITENFGLIEEKDKLGIDGEYNLDGTTQELILIKFIGGRYIYPINSINEIDEKDKIDKIDEEELRKIQGKFHLTEANGSGRLYAIYLIEDKKIGILRCEKN